MASAVALRIRENQAIERIAKALGVGVDDLTPEQVKPVMRHTVRLETIAGLLEEKAAKEEATQEETAKEEATPKSRKTKPKSKAAAE